MSFQCSVVMLLCASFLVHLGDGCLTEPVMDDDTTSALTMLQVKAQAHSGRMSGSSATSHDAGLPMDDFSELTSVVHVPSKPAGEVGHAMSGVINGKSDRAIVMLTMYRIVQEFTAFIGVIVLAVGILSFKNLKGNHQKTEERAPVVRTRVDQLIATSKLGTQYITPQALQNLQQSPGSGDAEASVHVRCVSLDSDEGLPVEDNARLADVMPEPCQVWKPLERQLVLPLCETWYAVKTADLQKQLMLGNSGGIDILRPTGYLALRAEVRQSGATGFILELWQSGGRAGSHKLLVTASTLPEEHDAASKDVEAPVLEFVDANGVQRGTVRPSSSTHYILSNGGEEVMNFSTDSDQVVLSSSHATVASAFWCSGNNIFRGPGHLAICVQPGTDTALAVSCSLSIALLGGRLSSLLPPPPEALMNM